MSRARSLIPTLNPQHGVQERSHLGQICGRGDILIQARNRFLPLLAQQILTLWVTSGAGGGGGKGLIYIYGNF
jgi:hypothetical protein